jgi:hypothetical protein
MSLPVPSPSGLPVEAKQQLQYLARRLDGLVSLGDSMQAAMEALEDDHDADAALGYAKDALKRYSKSSDRKALLNGKIEQTHNVLIAALPESDWWDDKGDVKVSAVARAVGMLISSFPQNLPNAEIFTSMMIEDVLDWTPHPFALGDACRELRLKMKFTPSISELHVAYEAALQKWMERWDWQDSVEYVAKQLTTLIEQKEQQREQERLEQQQREVREREARVKREAIEREQADVRKFLREVNDVVSVDVEAQAPYRHRVEALIDHAHFVAPYEKGLALGSKHHESCAVLHGGEACDCVPALWGIAVASKIIFWVDEDGRVTQPIWSCAETKARAVGRKP